MSSYSTIPFLLALPSLLLINKGKLKKLAIVLSIVIVLTTLVAYIPGTVIHMNYLTNSEKSAVEWYCSNRGDEKLVFTDFRIETAPIMLNCFYFTGITERNNARVEKDLRDIYYGNSPLNARNAINRYDGAFVLLSKEMMEFIARKTDTNPYLKRV